MIIWWELVKFERTPSPLKVSYNYPSPSWRRPTGVSRSLGLLPARLLHGEAGPGLHERGCDEVREELRAVRAVHRHGQYGPWRHDQT